MPCTSFVYLFVLFIGMTNWVMTNKVWPLLYSPYWVHLQVPLTYIILSDLSKAVLHYENRTLLLPYPNTLWFVITSEVFHFLELLVHTIPLQTTLWFSVTSLFSASLRCSSVPQCGISARLTLSCSVSRQLKAWGLKLGREGMGKKLEDLNWKWFPHLQTKAFLLQFIDYLFLICYSWLLVREVAWR